MTHHYRHPAFTKVRKGRPPKDGADPFPNTITDHEMRYLEMSLSSGTKVRNTLVKKLLRLYIERSAAAIQLIQKYGYEADADPENG